MRSWASLVAAATPRPLPGAELAPYPYISGYGVLWRVMRLSRLEPTEVYSRLGLRWDTTVDLLEAVQRDLDPRQRLATALGLEGTGIPRYWNEAVWSPLQAGKAFDGLRQPVRTCLRCAAHGYHTALFQLPSIERCPWHQLPLHGTCVHCNAPAHVRFHRHDRFGACRSCGLDPFDVNTAAVRMWTFPTRDAEAWLSSYFEWAAAQRATRHLVIPGAQVDWLPGFAALARPPESILPAGYGACPRMAEIEVLAGEENPPRPTPRELWSWSALGDDRPLTFVPLPASMHGRLSGITRHVIEALPQSSATPLELVTLNGLDESATLQQNIERRPDCLISPHGRSATGESWLNVSAVDLTTLQVCGQLIDGVIRWLKLPIERDDRSLQASRARALGDLPGCRHLVRALESILCRGYAQGLAALVRRLLQPDSNQAPGPWSVPVLEILGAEGRLDGIRICWVSTAPPHLRRPCEVSEPSPARIPRPPRGRRKRHSRGRAQAKSRTQ